MSKLITPTLLNSLKWYNMCPKSWKEKAFNDFSNMLNRTPFKPNKAFQLGKKFENQIYRICQGIRVKDPLPTVEDAVTICKGGIWQVTTKIFITYKNVEYCVYGKIDVLKKDVVIDIKTTGNYHGEDYYLSGYQHLFYLYALHKNYNPQSKFLYLVTDFNELHKIEVEYTNWNLVESHVHNAIHTLLEFLEKYPDLKKAYNSVFSRY